MTNKTLIFMVVSCLFIAGAYQRTYTEIYDAYCTDSFLNGLDMTEAERAEKRASQKGPYVSGNSIMDIIKNQNPSQTLKEAGAYIILIIILTVVCLISFFTFLGFCCCCDRANNNTKTKTKVYTFFTLIFIVTFAALFIALIVFLGKLNANKSDTSCAIASIPKDLLDGVNTPDLKFLGFKQLITIINNFKNDLNSISGLSKDFDSVINQNLPVSSKAALDSLPVFYNKYKDSTTSDGAGASSKPQTITSLTTNINDAIYTEFSVFDTVAQKIHEAAQTGKGYAQSNDISSVQSSLDKIATELTTMSDQISNVFGSTVTGIDYFNQYAPIGYWITLGLGLLVSILGIIAVILIIQMIRKSNDHCRMGVKFCLSFNGFLIFLLGILAIILLIASISLNSVCHEVGEILSTNDISNKLQSYGVTIDPLFVKVINQCLPQGASGDITNLITGNTNVFNQSQTFLDGLTLYNTLKANLTQAGDTSPTINGTSEIWKQFKVSVYPDQANAVVSLNQLNGLINCGSVSFQLNSQNCTSAGCKGIYDTATFTPPSCSSNANQATTLYNNLRKFTQEEDTLLGNMITDLTGSNSNTPLSLNNALRTKIKGVFSSMDNVQSKLKNTIDLVANFNNGFASNLNCTVLRRELNNLESSFCYNFNQSLYYFAALLTWIVFFLLFYSWCICYALRCMPTGENATFSQKVNNDAQFYAQDHERTPVY